MVSQQIGWNISPKGNFFPSPTKEKSFSYCPTIKGVFETLQKDLWIPAVSGTTGVGCLEPTSERRVEPMGVKKKFRTVKSKRI